MTFSTAAKKRTAGQCFFRITADFKCEIPTNRFASDLAHYFDVENNNNEHTALNPYFRFDIFHYVNGNKHNNPHEVTRVRWCFEQQ